MKTYFDVQSFVHRDLGMHEGDFKLCVAVATRKASTYLEERTQDNAEIWVKRILSTTTNAVVDGTYAMYVITLTLEMEYDDENEAVESEKVV